MKVRTLTIVATAAVMSLGCDKIPFLNQLGQGGEAPDTTAADTATAADTTPQTPAPAPAPAEETPPPQQPAAQPEPQPRRQPVAQRPINRPRQQSGDMAEVPWNPEFTGTVRPGMTPDEVVEEWGAPEVRRDIGNRTYLFYRNGCEKACGTFDVVLLEDGQVVDAIVRGRGHEYAGTSSSPPDRVAEFTPPQSAVTRGDTG